MFEIAIVPAEPVATILGSTILPAESWKSAAEGAESPVTVDTGFGPDGRPAVFDGSGWFSADGRYRWNGTAWTPVARPRLGASPWLMRIGLAVFFFAVVAYAVYTAVANTDAFVLGYYIGLVAFFGLNIWVFRAAGNWGWIGIFVRMATGGLMLLRLLALLSHPPPT